MEFQWENHFYMCHNISPLKAIEESSSGLADRWVFVIQKTRVFVQLRKPNIGYFITDFSWQYVLLCPSAKPCVWECTAPSALRVRASKLQGFVIYDVFLYALSRYLRSWWLLYSSHYKLWSLCYRNISSQSSSFSFNEKIKNQTQTHMLDTQFSISNRNLIQKSHTCFIYI